MARKPAFWGDFFLSSHFPICYIDTINQVNGGKTTLISALFSCHHIIEIILRLLWCFWGWYQHSVCSLALLSWSQMAPCRQLSTGRRWGSSPEEECSFSFHIFIYICNICLYIMIYPMGYSRFPDLLQNYVLLGEGSLQLILLYKKKGGRVFIMIINP